MYRNTCIAVNPGFNTPLGASPEWLKEHKIFQGEFRDYGSARAFGRIVGKQETDKCVSMISGLGLSASNRRTSAPSFHEECSAHVRVIRLATLRMHVAGRVAPCRPSVEEHFEGLGKYLLLPAKHLR